MAAAVTAAVVAIPVAAVGGTWAARPRRLRRMAAAAWLLGLRCRRPRFGFLRRRGGRVGGRSLVELIRLLCADVRSDICNRDGRRHRYPSGVIPVS